MSEYYSLYLPCNIGFRNIIGSFTLKNCFFGSELTGKGAWALAGFWGWHTNYGTTYSDTKYGPDHYPDIPPEWWRQDRSGRYDWPKPGADVELFASSGTRVAAVRSVYRDDIFRYIRDLRKAQEVTRRSMSLHAAKNRPTGGQFASAQATQRMQGTGDFYADRKRFLWTLVDTMPGWIG